ncbi:hypothetical protein GCM10023350_53100 [Nocardioides endophyticus]|uniref:Uncharacterized protein n=1 Tax=Nocardioides endophyticus TaxID=1353775 RepID=A0ABP8ZN38_9ACTN
MASEEFVARLSPEDYGRLEESLRTKDMTEAYAILTMLGEHRSRALAAFASAETDVAREVMREILQESRATEAFIYDLVRRVKDDLHSEAMLGLAKTSNGIAASAEQTAQSLRNWTKALVLATIVLAVATVALVGATLTL